MEDTEHCSPIERSMPDLTADEVVCGSRTATLRSCEYEYCMELGKWRRVGNIIGTIGKVEFGGWSLDGHGRWKTAELAADQLA